MKSCPDQEEFDLEINLGENIFIVHVHDNLSYEEHFFLPATKNSFVFTGCCACFLYASIDVGKG